MGDFLQLVGRGRHALAWVLVGSSWACQAGRPFAVAFPAVPAAGRPVACPEGTPDPGTSAHGAGVVSRCAYADAEGRVETTFRGKVLRLAEGDLAGRGLAGVRVEVRTGTELVSHATTDAQGGFRVKAMLSPGSYRLRVLEADEAGEPREVASAAVEVPEGRPVFDHRLDVYVPGPGRGGPAAVPASAGPRT